MTLTLALLFLPTAAQAEEPGETGGGAGKLFKIGKQAMNVRGEAYYNVVTPDAGPEWQWGFTVQFLFPK